MVHATTRKTPFEGLYGVKPDIGHLKLFGSRVCVKQSGKRRSKLDRHDFKGLFLGYTATDQNIVYLDLDSGVVKQSHHAQFDKAWYLQDSRPPAAQLLFDLGVTDDAATYTASGVLYDESVISNFCLPSTVEPVQVPWPPCAPGNRSLRQNGRSQTYVLGSHSPFQICQWWFPHVDRPVPERLQPTLRPQHPAERVHLGHGILC